ncbi:glycerophosphodiester phosphodiesterase family protein [Cyclobacteriaceae bacterium]|jgi:glycerophosphoryl diester phosphodiesterase|nr:glycerophosphodiester phosphodiesterase family protein [Cyclobacteriaceae bacterium]MDB4316166.1 glycerophosphodiester phosphodiesterase family protein [Cyclobacteriaceae bacterium]MDC6484141.1 glycerophosphodiester phosphodiesterase family protein [Cyclobacteriaceae bacterium]|tara:strand:+ start:401 stop:1303 length:903 start_codon:yes stop_codon:yes gene_type:complete
MRNLLIFIALLACVQCGQQSTSDVSDEGGSLDLQGHRGMRGLFPENSILGFLKALELGVNTLELDIVMSGDTQLVVSHEPFISSAICQYPGGKQIPKEMEKELNMYHMTYQEIKAFDCGSLFNNDFLLQEKSRISKPLLTEVLDTVEQVATAKGQLIHYNIELKSELALEGIYHPEVAVFCQVAYQAINDQVDWRRITIQSFDFRILRYFNKHYPEVQLALLIENELSWELNIDSLGFKPEIYSCDYALLSAETISELQEINMKVIPWTVNDSIDMRQLIHWGVNGLITDYPNIALQILN